MNCSFHTTNKLPNSRIYSSPVLNWKWGETQGNQTSTGYTITQPLHKQLINSIRTPSQSYFTNSVQSFYTTNNGHYYVSHTHTHNVIFTWMQLLLWILFQSHLNFSLSNVGVPCSQHDNFSHVKLDNPIAYTIQGPCTKS